MLKFSIITVAFNSELTIRDTFDSVLAQTYTEIEYLVIDGNSSDSTVSIIKEYEPKFKGRMSWVSEADNGLYDAMNKGISMASGDIVGIINSDDFYHRNDSISLIAKAFDDRSIQATVADVRFVKPDNLNKTVRYYSSKYFSPNLFRFGFMPAHPSFFSYKHNFEIFGSYKTNYKIAADFELLIRFLYTHELKFKYLPIDVMKMRTGGASTKSLKSNWILNAEIVRACKENNIYTNIFILFFKYFVKVFELIIIKK
jgi:glycosyltransferase involved in cell wall biosynthesis